MKERVCVLLAGRGQRMGETSEWIHKSLLSVGRRAILSRILELFSPDSEFVFAVHHRAQDIQDFMSIAHPETKVTYVHVTEIDGPGSGPGASLLHCREELNQPFYLVCGDTLFDQLPNNQGNWAAVPSGVEDPGPRWCNFFCENGKVLKIADKVSVSGPAWKPFIGLARIEDTYEFFDGLASSCEGKRAGEVQISDGLQALTSNLQAVTVDWKDTGSFENYVTLSQDLLPAQNLKHGEQVYFEGSKVIRFFDDPKIVSGRQGRAQILADFVPPISQARGKFFCYEFVEGKTLAETNDLQVWESTLSEFRRRLWRPVFNSPGDFQSACTEFYFRKTLTRLNKFYSRHGVREDLINDELRDHADQFRKSAIPSRIHGDLQPENIIIGDRGGIHLIDWRQDFGGLKDVGDLCWDLAKFNVYMVLHQQHVRPELFAMWIEFVRRMDVEMTHLNRLSALALIQMAGLHAGPEGPRYYKLGLQCLRAGEWTRNETLLRAA
ncbi:MAG: NTP transferase domain-containing protein [Bdellovibrionales bacterium]